MRWAMILVATGLCAARAPARPLDRRLPSDTLFYASLNDLPRTVARGRGGRWARHWSDPRMQELRALGAEWLARAQADHAAAGRPWPPDLLAVADGQVVLAVVPAPDGPAGIILVESHAPVPAAARAFAVRKGDGWFAVARDAVTLGVLVRPGAAALDGHPAFRRVREATGAGADVTLWAPAGAVTEVSAGRPALASLMHISGGVRTIGGLGAGLTLEEGALVTRLFLHVPRKRGLLRVFDVPNRPLAPPALAPRGVDSFTTVRLNLPALAGALREVDPGIDFEALVEGVGGPVALRFLRGLGEEFATVRRDGREVLVAEVRSARVRREMAAFAGAVSRPDAEGDRPLFLGPDGSALALVDDRLVAGAAQEDVRAMLRGGGRVSDDPECREAMAPLPPGRILLWWKRGPVREDGEPGFWRGQACALVNERDGLSLTHVLLAR